MLNITYYTDPLCCWSWGFEPQWRRLLFEYQGAVEWKYCMGGLLPSWNNYNDEVNSVTRPIQMGPVWMHAAQVSGMPINTRIWMNDPPASSYPACLAVCSAMLQSKEAGDGYLRYLREAVIIDGANVAKADTLRALASQFAADQATGFDITRFNEDFENGKGLEAFKANMNEVRLHSINRFPSLVIKAATGAAILLTGYRLYESLIAAIQSIAPGLQKTHTNPTIEQYNAYWPRHTNRELQEVFSSANELPGLGS